MNTLVIRKKSLKTWLHTDSVLGDFIISKFYFNADNVSFQIVEQGQSKRVIYKIANITLYDDVNSGGAETFSTITELSLRLEALKYPAFQQDGQITTIAGLIEAGTNVNITGDGTELSPYIINATGGGTGGVPEAPDNANAYVRSGLSWVVGYTRTQIDTLLTARTFIHTQITPATTWNITHNLGRNAKSVITDNAGVEYEGQIIHTNINQLTITFNTAFSGKATLT